MYVESTAGREGLTDYESTKARLAEIRQVEAKLKAEATQEGEFVGDSPKKSPHRPTSASGRPPQETKKGECYRSSDGAIVVPRRSWGNIFLWKTPRKKKGAKKKEKPRPRSTLRRTIFCPKNGEHLTHLTNRIP
jgi:hypothetical protein